MKATIITLSLLLTTFNSYASSRTDDVLKEDSYNRLQKISEIKADLAEKQTALTALEKELSEQVIMASKQKTAIVLLEVGVVGLVVTTLFIKFPHSSKSLSVGEGVLDAIGDGLLGMLGIVGSTVTTATGAIKYVLNINDAKALEEKVQLAKDASKKIEENLNREIIQLCMIDSVHMICH
jgi:hypothetical protein